MAVGAARRNIGLKTKIIGLLGTVLLALLLVDIVWTYHTQKQATEAVMLEESRILVAEMDVPAVCTKFTGIHFNRFKYILKLLKSQAVEFQLFSYFLDHSDMFFR